jgi:hypothetical protein
MPVPSQLVFAVFGVLSLLITAAGLVFWRREAPVFAIALVSLFTPGLVLANQDLYAASPAVLVMFISGAAAGLAAYSLMRIRPLQFGPVAAAFGGGACAFLAPVLAVRAAGSMWPPYVIPVGLVVAFVLALVMVLLRATLGTTMDAGPDAGSSEGATEERLATLRLLREGKISAEEASQLLEALGDATPGDMLPMTKGLRTSIVGGILIVVGFMLPWAHVKMGGVEGYQAGYHVGVLGWLILVLGVLPAVLACIPALDTHVRQALLRLLLACTGVAFAMPMVLQALAAETLPGVGLFLVLAGFGLQLLTALTGSGVLRPAPRK